MPSKEPLNKSCDKHAFLLPIQRDKTVANSNWRLVGRQQMVSGEWRVANSEWFSGGQRSCAAEKFFGASVDAP
jgi:hypothetical protein